MYRVVDPSGEARNDPGTTGSTMPPLMALMRDSENPTTGFENSTTTSTAVPAWYGSAKMVVSAGRLSFTGAYRMVRVAAMLPGDATTSLATKMVMSVLAVGTMDSRNREKKPACRRRDPCGAAVSSVSGTMDARTLSPSASCTSSASVADNSRRDVLRCACTSTTSSVRKSLTLTGAPNVKYTSMGCTAPHGGSTPLWYVGPSTDKNVPPPMAP